MTHSADLQNELRAAVSRACAGEIIRFDALVRMAGDTRMWVDFQLAPLRASNGSITHLVPAHAYGEYKAWRPETGQRLTSANWALTKVIGDKITITDEVPEIESFDGAKKMIRNFATPLRSVNGEDYRDLRRRRHHGGTACRRSVAAEPGTSA